MEVKQDLKQAIDNEIKWYTSIKYSKIFTDSIDFECVLDDRMTGCYILKQFMHISQPVGFINRLSVYTRSNMVNRGSIEFDFSLNVRKLYNECQKLQLYDLSFLIKYLNKADCYFIISNKTNYMRFDIDKNNLNVLEKVVKLVEYEDKNDAHLDFYIMLDTNLECIDKFYNLTLPADSKPKFKAHIKF